MGKHKTDTRNVRILFVIKGINLFRRTLTRLNKKEIIKIATKHTEIRNKKGQ